LSEEVQTYGLGNISPNASRVNIFPSHYAKNLMEIYKSLPDSTEVRGGELKSLVEISPGLMESCTRVIVGEQEL
jgi:hypothetical protein